MNIKQIKKLCCELSTEERLTRISDWYDSLKESQKEYEQTTVHQQSEFRNDVVSIEDVKRILSCKSRKWKHNLQFRIYPFVHHLYWTTSKSIIRERPISTFNKKLVDTIGSQQNVSNARKDLERIDCIKCIKDSWWFGKKDFNYQMKDGGIANIKSKFDPSCKVYIINRKVVELVYNWCLKEYGKLEYNRQDTVNVELEESEQFLNDNRIDYKKFYDKIRVSSKLNMDVSRFGVQFNGKKGLEGKKIVQSIVNVCVTEKHPFIKYYMNVRKELNKNLPYCCKGVFELKCHYSQSQCHLTKIGIRDNNECCNLKAHESTKLVKTDSGNYRWVKKESNYNGTWFHDAAKTILKTETIYEHDVKSSVPRVLWLLKTGEWLDEDVDMYSLILGEKITGVERDCFKRFVLIALFSSSVDEMIRNFKPAFTKSEWKMFGNQIASIFNFLKERLESMFGVVKDSLVFAHESAIYMEVEKRLQNAGINYIKKYDCFYMDQEVVNISEIIKSCAINYYKHWISKCSSNNKKCEEKVDKREMYDNTKIQNVPPVKTPTDLKFESSNRNPYWKVAEFRNMLI